MSTSISISIFPRGDDYSTVATVLLGRLALKLAGLQMRLHRGYWGKTPLKPQAVDVAKLVASASAERIFESASAIEAFGAYQLKSGKHIGLSLVFIGKYFGGGANAEADGQLQVKLEHAQLRTARDAIQRERADSVAVSYDDAEPSALGDWEDLMITCCCLPRVANEQRVVGHLSAYRESGWPSPIGCAATYHDSMHEFIKDFARIFMEYVYGYSMPQLYSAGDHPDPGTGPAFSAARTSPDFYRQFDASGAIETFLQSMHKDDVWRLWQRAPDISSDWLRDALKDAAGEHFHDFGTGGGLLLTAPLSTTFSIYRSLYLMASHSL